MFLDVRDSMDVNGQKIRRTAHSVLPLCDGGLDQVIGFIRSTKLLHHLLSAETMDLRALAEPSLFVPVTVTLMTLLEQFKRAHLPVALVVDEFGGVAGLVSLSDVIGSIVGDLPSEPGEEPAIVRRDDGSWLLDGALDMDTVLRALDAESLLGDEDRQHYHTLGGLAMLALSNLLLLATLGLSGLWLLHRVWRIARDTPVAGMEGDWIVVLGARLIHDRSVKKAM